MFVHEHSTIMVNITHILPIKDKVLAAHRAGIKTIIIPKWNEKDLEDIPKEVQKKIDFHFVDRMQDVLKLAFQ